MAVGLGGFRRSFLAVSPGILMKFLSTAEIKVDSAGEPNAACQKLQKSALESKRIAVRATFGVISFMFRVDKSTVHNPDDASLAPYNISTPSKFKTRTQCSLKITCVFSATSSETLIRDSVISGKMCVFILGHPGSVSCPM